MREVAGQARVYDSRSEYKGVPPDIEWPHGLPVDVATEAAKLIMDWQEASGLTIDLVFRLFPLLASGERLLKGQAIEP